MTSFPAFQGDDVEKGEDGDSEVAPVFGVVLAEQVEADDGVDVDDDAHEHHDVSDAGNRPDERGDDEPEVIDGGDEAEDAQKARKPDDDCQFAGRGDEREHYHEEVEDVPAVAEVADGTR